MDFMIEIQLNHIRNVTGKAKFNITNLKVPLTVNLNILNLKVPLNLNIINLKVSLNLNILNLQVTLMNTENQNFLLHHNDSELTVSVCG